MLVSGNICQENFFFYKYFDNLNSNFRLFLARYIIIGSISLIPQYTACSFVLFVYLQCISWYLSPENIGMLPSPPGSHLACTVHHPMIQDICLHFWARRWSLCVAIEENFNIVCSLCEIIFRGFNCDCCRVAVLFFPWHASLGECCHSPCSFYITCL